MAIYFASDFHLGLNAKKPSKEREQIIISWFDQISTDVESLYILGDLFDYWFEYRHVVPKGHIRVLAKIAELTDKGIPVHLFTGNHDLWMFDYLSEELGVKIYKKPIYTTINNKVFLLGHGDGLGPNDHGYKFIKRIFSNKINQWLFARIHPNLGMSMMKFFSRKSRESESTITPFQGADKEWLIIYAEEQIKIKHFDFCIFGHRHLPLDITLSNKSSRYINTGDWFEHYSYAKFESGTLELKYFLQ
ncbi:MAG: UDP-2,3-diacylglucosamine diphosphatase [Saprospiraceae bacterium]|nr:UDP-2,3-diacylglucosamine diphosphatase [Saprospiraceae bacterium]